MSDAQEFVKLMYELIPTENRKKESLFLVTAEHATRTVNNKGWYGGAIRFNDQGNVIANRFANIFVCISSIKQSLHPETGKPRFWRSKANFGRGLAFMIDDIGSGDGSKGNMTIEDFSRILQPTAVVETSPGNHQIWYVLKEGIEDRDLFERSLKAFIDKVLTTGGDQTVKDIVRLGRVGFGINNKTKQDENGNEILKYPSIDDPLEPWKVRITQFNKDAQFSLIEILDAFNVILPPKAEPKPKPSRFDSAIESAQFEIAFSILEKAKYAEDGGPLVRNNRNSYRIRCPWGHEHSNGDPTGAFFRGPNENEAYEHDYVFNCSHDSCKKNRRSWAMFVDHVVIGFLANHFTRVNKSFTFDELIKYNANFNEKRRKGLTF